ncbi:MAG: adenine phosphoribosyltransferase [Tunicatimonas sp.]
MKLALSDYVRTIPDFPKEGIQFKDITPLLQHPGAVKQAADALAALARAAGVHKVVAVEARGFWLGPLIADRLSVGWVPVRKAGKLPAPTHAVSYDLEYGTDQLFMHRDAIAPGEAVLVHDDLLATGGTARAACQLVEAGGGRVVQVSFLVELAFLSGRNRLKPYSVRSLLSYDK